MKDLVRLSSTESREAEIIDTWGDELTLPKVNATIEEPIPASSHPTHYLIHKYWSRKPHNVVSEYIRHFTEENDLVLDPFMGSGVTIIESCKTNRNSIGIDINPMSTFITKCITKRADLEKYSEEFHKIYQKAMDELSKYYITICPTCGKDANSQLQIYVERVICPKCSNVVRLDESNRRGSTFYCSDSACDASLIRGQEYSDELLLKVRGFCQSCGTFKKHPDTFDFELIKNTQECFEEYKKRNKMWYPDDSMADFVKRAGKIRLSELFSERTLICLSAIRNEIEKIKDDDIKDLMFLTFTSLLPNVSKLIPGDVENVRGKSGWQIPKFHVFPIHTEKNVLLTFKDRFNLIEKGKKEINKEDLYLKTELHTQSSEDLSFIRDETVDYIFTDPPYGSSIPYLGLSHLWNSWMKFDVNYKNEIIHDLTRKKDYEDYAQGLTNVFNECYRVLKTNHYMSLTFNTRDLKIWGILLESCRSAGFELVNIVHQPQAVSSATQGLNWKTTLTGDFIYNFVKSKNNKIREVFEGDFNTLVLTESKKIIVEKSGTTTAEIFVHLIPILVNENALSSVNCENDIEQILRKEFNFIKIINERKNNKAQSNNATYNWVLKDI